MGNPQGRIKKSKKEIEKGEFEGLIIDRPKSQQEIDTQIDQLDGGFQKTECSEEMPELEGDGDRYSEGLGDVLPGNENMDHPIPQMFEWGGEEKEERPKKKRRGNQIPWK